jgi:type I restriction enzyme S subunit
MTTPLKPYAEYKDSGVPWLGQVPGHWAVARNKLLMCERNDRSFDGSEELLTVSQYTGVSRRRDRLSGDSGLLTSATSLVGYKRVAPGDLVMNIMLAWNGSLGVSAIDGIVSPAYCVFRVGPDLDSRYLHYLLGTPLFTGAFRQASTGVVDSRLRLYPDVFFRLPSLLPPRSEQAAIVRFLDLADRRIRRYIWAKQKLIRLLGEQTRDVIYRAVTHGLDPKVRLKPSGADWLGDVPEHWQLQRLRTLVARIEQGVSPQAEAGLAAHDQWGVLKSGCVNRGIFRDTEHKRLPAGFPFDPSLQVQLGDVIVSRASGSPELVGSVALVDKLRYRVILSDKTFRLVFTHPTFARFFVDAMNSRYWRSQVEQAISGAEGLANNLPLAALKDFLLLVPPEDEASHIVEVLRQHLEKLGRSISSAERQLVLVREYRTRLTADLVTGKLDVREAAAALPSEPPDMEPSELAESESDEGSAAELESADLPEEVVA